MKLENDIAQHLEQGEFLALATIIDRSGSAPRHAGAQMLVTRDLSVIGTIGGGQVESDAVSYTHLDVYKRQAPFPRMKPSRWARIRSSCPSGSG